MFPIPIQKKNQLHIVYIQKCAVQNMKTIEINNTLDATFLKINFHSLNVHNVRFKLASFTEQEITFRIYFFCQCPLGSFFWVCQAQLFLYSNFP